MDASSDESPKNYYRPLKEIQDRMPRDAVFVTEGGNTMAIARQVIQSYEPRKRLDAGTWGTMGVGPGFALAAQVVNPGKRVIALEGDAAFGFGPGEVETAVRQKLPITWIIINNNGIGGGAPELPEEYETGRLSRRGSSRRWRTTRRSWKPSAARATTARSAGRAGGGA